MEPAASTLQVVITNQEYDRKIDALQQQIMALHVQKKRKMIFDGIEINTRACGGLCNKPAAEANTTANPNPVTLMHPEPAIMLEPIINNQLPPKPSVPAAVIPQPIHPFSNAKDANYLPPSN